jgi:TetR/AcrR family transcriptional regulator, ethionamide resistance regulator
MNKSSPPRVSPQPTQKIGKSERTRATILNAALDFIWTQPFRDMTVSSLMASTDLSRSAFYPHFNDLHEVMETLLEMLQVEIFDAAAPWVSGVGDPVALMHESLDGLVCVCYQRGPFLRAISDAATTEERFEKGWEKFLGQFDEAACARIEADQKQGLIPNFDALPVAIALNRLDAYTLIEAFGQRPRREPEPVREALARIWVSTLYGSEWLEKGSSNLVRT